MESKVWRNRCLAPPVVDSNISPTVPDGSGPCAKSLNMVSDYHQDVGDKEMKSPSMHQFEKPAVPRIPNYTSPERPKPQEGFFPTQDQDCPVAGKEDHILSTYDSRKLHLLNRPFTGSRMSKYPEKPNPQLPGRDFGTQEDSFESDSNEVKGCRSLDRH
ncbi:hypothetical protein B0H13DRAFT_1899740 [Mycena leptocephala]|nr:hypothetical protein B0H13DRAFT_1899740 [Mycena leptocephala]